MMDRAARIVDLEEAKRAGRLDKSGETELRVLTEARDHEDQLRAWWEHHGSAASFWDYTSNEGSQGAAS